MKYSVTFKTLTPLHIGSGAELLAEFDFFVPDKDSARTYVLDQHAVYEAEVRVGGDAARLDQTPVTLLRNRSVPPDPRFVRYALSGAPARDMTVLREQLKDVRDGLYLPGSSVKGALRTAVAQYLFGTQRYQPDRTQLRDRAEQADDAWMRDLFGDTPQQDVFRTLRVSDSRALPIGPDQLQVCLVRPFLSARQYSAPIAVEAVAPGVVFETEIDIDELTLNYAADPDYDQDLEWQDRLGLISGWLPMVRESSRAQLRELQRKARFLGYDSMAAFCEQQLASSDRWIEEGVFALQVGWGAGWESTTVGLYLEGDLWQDVRTRYRLGRPPEGGADWDPDLSKPFPKSRRLVSDESGSGPAPGLPLGWLRATLRPTRSHGIWERLVHAYPPPADPLEPAARSVSEIANRKKRDEDAHHAIPLFVATPTRGQVFQTRVDDITKEGVYLQLFGLEKENMLALIERRNLTGAVPALGQSLIAEVLEVNEHPDEPGLILVRCREFAAR